MSAYIFDKLISNYQFNIPPEILNKFSSLKDTNLKNNRAGIFYLYILDQYVCNGGYCYLQVKEEAKKWRNTHYTIYNWLNQLKEEGLIITFYDRRICKWEVKITHEFYIKLINKELRKKRYQKTY